MALLLLTSNAHRSIALSPRAASDFAKPELTQEQLSRAIQDTEVAMVELVGHLLDIDYGVALGGSPVKPVDSYDGPLTSKWWFWSAIGVGTIGAVTAAIMSTQEDPPPAPTTGSMIVRF